MVLCVLVSKVRLMLNFVLVCLLLVIDWNIRFIGVFWLMVCMVFVMWVSMYDCVGMV